MKKILPILMLFSCLGLEAMAPRRLDFGQGVPVTPAVLLISVKTSDHKIRQVPVDRYTTLESLHGDIGLMGGPIPIPFKVKEFDEVDDYVENLTKIRARRMNLLRALEIFDYLNVKGGAWTYVYTAFLNSNPTEAVNYGAFPKEIVRQMTKKTRSYEARVNASMNKISSLSHAIEKKPVKIRRIGGDREFRNRLHERNLEERAFRLNNPHLYH